MECKSGLPTQLWCKLGKDTVFSSVFCWSRVIIIYYLDFSVSSGSPFCSSRENWLLFCVYLWAFPDYSLIQQLVWNIQSRKKPKQNKTTRELASLSCSLGPKIPSQFTFFHLLFRVFLCLIAVIYIFLN